MSKQKPKQKEQANVHEVCDQQIEALKKEVAAKTKKNERLEKRFKDVEAAALSAVADYNGRFNEQQEKVKAAETARATAETELRLARSNHEKQLAETNQKQGTAVKKLRAEIEDLRSRVQASDEAKAKLVNEISELSKANDSWVEYGASVVAALVDAGVDMEAVENNAVEGIRKLSGRRAKEEPSSASPDDETVDADQS